MISIVVPVYNAEKYLNKCIESILAQTYQNWELILVENGSTDGSMALCKSYAEKDIRITVFQQHQNQGVSVARNLGLEKCSGEYITFVDADDWIKEDYLEHLVRMQKETDADMLVCQYQKVYDADRREDSSAHGNKEEYMESVTAESYELKEYTVAEYLEQCILEGYTHCWGVLYKNDLLDGVRFPSKIAIGEDALFLIDTVLRVEKIVVTGYAGYQYYINEKGAMKRKFTPSYMDQIACWQQAMDKLQEGYPNLKKKLESILVVSTMLVVGKIAVLEKEEQECYIREQEICHKIVREYGRKAGIRKFLPYGYPIKVMLYDYLPGVYLKLYGSWKISREKQ